MRNDSEEQEPSHPRVFNDIADGVLIVSVETGNIESVNESVLQLTGFDRDKLEGQPFESILLPYDAGSDLLMTRLSETDNTQESISAEFDLARKNDESLPVGVHLTPSIIQGSPVIIASLRDITHWKEIESEIRQKNKLLTLLNRIFRHDVRNDMMLSNGWLSHIKSDIDDEETRKRIEQVRTACKHSAELSSSISELVGIIDNTSKMTRKTISVDSYIEREVELIEQKYPRVKISKPDKENVSATAGTLFSSVIGNILSNAVQHNDKDERKIDISITETDDTVKISIADNGPGIPETVQESIFESTNKGEDSDGLGVGLYLIKTVVKKYDGEIVVDENEQLGGAEFSVILPKG